MTRASIKQSAKGLLGRTFRKLRTALPRPVGDQLTGLIEKLRVTRARALAPYWERREKPDAARRLVRLGFVGAGRYAQNHLQVLHNLDRVELSALLTTGGPKAKAVAAKYAIDRTFVDPAAFFALRDVDAYVVVVPPEFLKPLGLMALGTGKPLLIEKPPGVTAADTAELMAHAAAYRTFGMVCMNRRFYSVLEHGLAHLALCGPIRAMAVETPHQVTRDRQSGRVSAFDYEHYFMRMSIHGVDLIRYVLGDPLRVHSLAFSNAAFHNASASFAATLEYPRGVIATITDAWDTPPAWRIKVIAETGWLELEPLEQGFIVKAETNLHGRLSKVALRPDPVDQEFRAGVYAQDLHFVDAVRRGIKPTLPACLLPDAHRTMILMEQILGGTLPRVWSG